MIGACGCATSRPRVGITERTACAIVTDLTEAGYVVKHKDGRRNRYPDPGVPAASPAAASA
jgi:hypothetical protein